MVVEAGKEISPPTKACTTVVILGSEGRRTVDMASGCFVLSQVVIFFIFSFLCVLLVTHIAGITK